MTTDFSNLDIEQCKLFANSEAYFKLFEKHLTGSYNKCLLYMIGNIETIANIMRKNEKATYYIYDNGLVVDCLKAGMPDWKKFHVMQADSRKTTNEQLWNGVKKMKFDKIIMNPPYGGNANLYGLITYEAKRHAKSVICLSPYLNYLDNAQRKAVKDLAAKLMPSLKEYELVSNFGFDAHFDKELCIFDFEDNVENPADINEVYWKQFNNPSLTKSILDKIKSYGTFCYDFIIGKKKFDEHEYKVVFTGVRGNFDASTGKKRWDWTTILDEDKMMNFKISSTTKGDLTGIPFNDEYECKNFVDYANSDIFGFLILVQKHSMNMDKWLYHLIPYLDFTKHWTDEDLCKEFGLTDDEYTYIVEEMKDYGWKTRK